MRVETFIQAIDTAWPRAHDSRIRLNVIGSAALMLQTSLTRGTKDSDVLEAQLTSEVQAALRALAGPETRLAKRHSMFIDIVRDGVPFLRQTPSWKSLPELNASLTHFEVNVLEVVDVVVSKLKPFRASDRGDIDEMVQLGLVPHDRLIERFEAAVDWFSGDARAEDLPRFVRNLHFVETNSLFVDETNIELPSWVAR